MPAEVGQPAPEFTLIDQDKAERSLADFRGHKTLLVFIPFPFTGICDAEACAIRDNLASLRNLDAEVAIVTTHSFATNKQWATSQGFEFPVLADYWPHGAVAQAYGCFNDAIGVAMRASYVIDAEGILREIVATDSLGTPREYSAYTDALSKL